MIQEARARDMVGSFSQMPDAAAATTPSAESAKAALAFLTEMSPDLRGAAILGSGGGGARAPREGGGGGGGGGRGPGWPGPPAAGGGGRAKKVHVSTEQGEVF